MSIRKGNKILAGGLLGSNNTTNCITYIPQDIKVEIDNGALVLKAGSKVYVPNGVNHFDEVILDNDVSQSFSINGTYLVGYAPYFNQICTYIKTSLAETEPTVSSESNGSTWYDTTNNVIKRAWEHTWQNSLFSLPFAKITISGGNVVNIDNVFNGFGYYNYKIFILPGVKYLIPNGKNSDGSLKNLYIEIERVSGTGGNAPQERMFGLMFNENKVQIGVINSLSSLFLSGKDGDKPTKVPYGNHTSYYATDTNLWYNTSGSTTANWSVYYPMICGVKNFRGLNYNDMVEWESFDQFSIANQADVEKKQDKATAVNYNNISNVITKIPQDIKLELNSGTLTLKAGSAVYVPAGKDGNTNIYNRIIIKNDISYSGTVGSSTRKSVWSLAADDYELTSNVVFGERGLENSQSGTSTPSSPIQYYNTTENIIHWSGTTNTRVSSFPLCIVSLESGVIKSIDQIFNGCGYIGGTSFIYPGIKGLIPNGRNDDGTLKSIMNETDNLTVYNVTGTNNVELWNGVYTGTGGYYYDRETNFIRHPTSKEPRYNFHIASYKMKDGQIYEFRQDQCYRIQSDFGKDYVDTYSNQVINGTKIFNGFTALRNDLEPSTFASGTYVEDVILDTSRNTNGDVDGPNIIRVRNTNGNTTVNYRAGFRHNNTDYWPTLVLGLKASDYKKYATLSVDEAYAPKPDDDTTANNNKIATTSWVNQNNSDASHNNVVHLDGLETIKSGKKIQSTTIDRPNPTSSNQYIYFDFIDKNSPANRLGVIGARLESSSGGGAYGTYMQAGNDAAMAVVSDGTNTRAFHTATVPTTNGTTGTYIPTTGWVNDPSKSTNVVHRSGDETIDGVKNFNKQIKGYLATYSCHNGNYTNYWYKMGTWKLYGTYNTRVTPFKMWGTVVDRPGVVDGTIMLRAGDGSSGAGYINTSATKVYFNIAPSWLSFSYFRLYYKNAQSDSGGAYVLVDLWCYITSAYSGYTFQFDSEQASGGAYGKDGTFYNLPSGQTSEPSGYTGYMSASSNLIGDHYVYDSQKPTSSNGYKWYRRYRDGYVEQGGICTDTLTAAKEMDATTTVSLPLTMKDTLYDVHVTNASDASSVTVWEMWAAENKKTTSFKIHMGAYANTRTITQVAWQVNGWQ